MPATSDRKRTWVALAICAGAYLYASPYYPTVNNPNENVRFYMTAAIVELGTYEIDHIRERWGWVNDAAIHHGHVFSVKAPGTSLLGVPGYAAYLGICSISGAEPDRTTALFVCRVTASVLPMLVFLFFFHAWLGRQTRHATLRDTTFFAVALGSLLYGYSLLFVSHSLSAASAFGAFMILFDARHAPGQVKRRTAFLAGLLTAGVTFFEYPGLVASVCLAVYAVVALRPRKQLVFFVLGGLLPTLAVMHFQNSAFQNPFTPGHLFVESSAFRAAHEEGLYGANGFHPEAAFALLFDRGSGLFPLTPLFAFAFVGFPRLFTDKKLRVDASFALATILLTYLLICLMNNWRGGWTIGPRYLATIVPFVAWAALHGLDAFASKLERIASLVAVGFAAGSVVASGIPSVYYPHIPPEITVPLSQLFGILIHHDFAPLNLLGLFGSYGTHSMIPLFVLWTFALAWCVWQRAIPIGERFGIAAGAALICGLVVGSLLQAPPRDRTVADAVAFVTRTWHPEGHDAAAVLEAKIAGSGDVVPADYEALAALYQTEGRDREARSAIRRGELAAERAQVVERQRSGSR